MKKKTNDDEGEERKKKIPIHFLLLYHEGDLLKNKSIKYNK